MKNRNLSSLEYFKRRALKHKPLYRFTGSTQEDFKGWKQELVARLKQCLGPMPEPVDLNPEIISEIVEDGLIKRKVVIDLEEDMSAVGWLYIPQGYKKPLPAILCCHGHGTFGKDSVMGVNEDNCPERAENIKEQNYNYGLQMAQKGYVTFAIDWRGFADTSRMEGYNTAITNIMFRLIFRYRGSPLRFVLCKKKSD